MWRHPLTQRSPSSLSPLALIFAPTSSTHLFINNAAIMLSPLPLSVHVAPGTPSSLSPPGISLSPFQARMPFLGPAAIMSSLTLKPCCLPSNGRIATRILSLVKPNVFSAVHVREGSHSSLSPPGLSLPRFQGRMSCRNHVLAHTLSFALHTRRLSRSPCHTRKSFFLLSHAGLSLCPFQTSMSLSVRVPLRAQLRFHFRHCAPSHCLNTASSKHLSSRCLNTASRKHV